MRHVGPGPARQIVLHRTALHAVDAQRLGIVDRIVPAPAKALPAELSRLLSLPPAALNLARQMLTEGGQMTYAQAYDSYKAAQFHALHRLAGARADAAAAPDPPYSAAEYVVAPTGPWLDPAEAGDEAGDEAEVEVEVSTTRPACSAELDDAGIAGAVLYPANLLRAYGDLHGPPFRALLRRYNDWVLDLCAGDPKRLRAAVLLDADDPDGAAAEVRRTAEAGAATAVVPLSRTTNSGTTARGTPRCGARWRTTGCRSRCTAAPAATSTGRTGRSTSRCTGWTGRRAASPPARTRCSTRSSTPSRAATPGWRWWR